MLHTLVLSLAIASRMSLMPQQADSVRPDNDIRLVALRHSSEIQRCYETEGLRVNPGLSGTLEVEGQVFSVSEGDAVFVEAGAEHRFTGYESLSVLVIFTRPD